MIKHVRNVIEWLLLGAVIVGIGYLSPAHAQSSGGFPSRPVFQSGTVRGLWSMAACQVLGVPCTTGTIPSSANPSQSIDLTTHNGSGTAYMLANAAPPLSQTISPTMTGNWIFSPSGGTAIDIESTNSSYGTFNTTNATGAFTRFRNSSTDAGFIGTGSATITGAALGDFGIAVAGSGNLRLGYGGGSFAALFINGSTGGVSVNTPSSSTALNISGLSASNTLQLNSTGAGGSFGQCWACGILVGAWNMWVAGTDPLVIGTQGSGLMQIASNNVVRESINSTGNVIFSAPTSGNGVTASAVGGNMSFLATAAAAVQAGVGIGQSGQIVWQLYQPASSNVLRLFDGTADRVIFTNSGGEQVGAPTGGDQGVGTINTTGLFKNGIAPVYYADSGTNFSGATAPTVGGSAICVASGTNCQISQATGSVSLTYTSGCLTGTTTASGNYSKIGNLVSVRFTSVTSCTTNTVSTTITYGGLPAAIQSAGTQFVVANLLQNGVNVIGYCSIGASAAVNCSQSNNAAFTAVSGINTTAMSYTLN